MERHLEKLCREYMEILSGEETARERYEILVERIRADRKKPGMTSEMSKSEMSFELLILLRMGMITREDLKDFSEEMRDYIEFAMAGYPERSGR